MKQDLPKNKRTGLAIGAVLFAALILLLAVAVFIPEPQSNLSDSDQSRDATDEAGADPVTGGGPSLKQDHTSSSKEEASMPHIQPDPACLAAIDRALAELGQAKSPAEAAGILRQLRESLLRAQEQVAAAAIVAFLQTGKDAPTGLPFDVGSEGILDSSPSLRVMLLDLLPSLDPYASVDVARQIIAEGRSQDEYAMALRNLSWNDLDGDMALELTDGFSRMLAREDWRLNPSAGFLEGFDIAVEVGGAQMLDRVAAVITPDRANASAQAKAVDRAAFIALDRIVLRDPSVLVDKFSENPAFLGNATRQRASLMSRLDIEDPAQRETFVRYLESSTHGEGELEYFSRLFPNGNYLHGHRLASEDEITPTIDQRQEMDRKALAVIKGLESKLTTGPARQAAAEITRRLEGFVNPPPRQ